MIYYQPAAIQSRLLSSFLLMRNWGKRCRSSLVNARQSLHGERITAIILNGFNLNCRIHVSSPLSVNWTIYKQRCVFFCMTMISDTQVACEEGIMYLQGINNVQYRIVLQDLLHPLHNLPWTSAFREASHAMASPSRLRLFSRFHRAELALRPHHVAIHACCGRSLLNCLRVSQMEPWIAGKDKDLHPN